MGAQAISAQAVVARFFSPQPQPPPRVERFGSYGDVRHERCAVPGGVQHAIVLPSSMMATTMYLWFRAFAVRDQYRSAVLISGLVTFIAAYHYIRIFNSWVDAYESSTAHHDPQRTG